MIVIDPMINKMDFDEKRDIQFINKKAVEGMQMVYDSFISLGQIKSTQPIRRHHRWNKIDDYGSGAIIIFCHALPN